MTLFYLEMEKRWLFPQPPANYLTRIGVGSPAWLLQLNIWPHAKRYPTPVEECEVRTWSSSSFSRGFSAVALVRTERGDQIGFRPHAKT